MPRTQTTALLLAGLLSLPLATTARAAPCERLSAAQRKLSQKIQRATHPYDCCDETLDRCLKQKRVCKLARRLRDAICRRLLKGETEKKILGALERRARSMTPMGKKATFDLTGAPAAGDAKAPVTVVAYACARCPFCAKVVPDLHRLVTAGGLKGKAKLFFRPFPIRNHKGSVEGGLAFVAAMRLGKHWPYLLKLYQEYDRFEVGKLDSWAARVGLEGGAFKREMRAKQTRAILTTSKKEGLRNRVKATPTLFINGRQYYGDMDHETLLDVLGEEADRRGGREYCGK
jgi:protein-disulfide isomerase